MTRHTKVMSVTLALSCCACWTTRVHCEPQWSSALRAGIAGSGTRQAPWNQTDFYGAAYLDVLLGRSNSNDIGIGPFLDVGTVGFSDIRLSAGPTVLLPLSSFAAQLSLGGYLVPTQPSSNGVHTQLFFGGRGYNYHAKYSPALGVVLGLDYGLSASHDVTLSSALSIDLEYIAIPFMMLYGALQPSD